MFGTRQNNGNSNVVNVNSQIYRSYSDTAQLTVSAWNKNLSIVVNPFTGRDQQNKRMYAKNDDPTSIATALTEDNVTALEEGLTKVIDPAIEAKAEASVSVTMGTTENRKVLTIRTKKNENDVDVYLEISQKVGENGVAESTLSHKFNKRSYLTNYNPQTGTNEEFPVNSDYMNFKKRLSDAHLLDGAVAHSIRYNTEMRESYSNKRARDNNFNNTNGGNSYSAPVYNSDTLDGGFLPNEY